MAAGQLSAPVLPLFRLQGVPVLLYHGLCESAEPYVPGRESKYWVSMHQFREQLGAIRWSGRAVLLDDFWGDARSTASEPSTMALTFDDGHISHYKVAFPALAAAGLRASFFLNTSAIGQAGYLSWAQIAEMQRAGLSFQSHSHDHVALTRLSRRELENQLERSKQLLEDRTGQPVRFLAAPYGLWDRRTARIAQRLGYCALCTSRPWPARPGASRVSRTTIYGDTSLDEFRRLLARDPVVYVARGARHAFLHLPKRVLLRWSPNQLGVRVLEKRA